MNPITMIITTVVLLLSIGIVAEINIDTIVLSGLKKKVKLKKTNKTDTDFNIYTIYDKACLVFVLY